MLMPLIASSRANGRCGMVEPSYRPRCPRSGSLTRGNPARYEKRDTSGGGGRSVLADRGEFEAERLAGAVGSGPDDHAAAVDPVGVEQGEPGSGGDQAVQVGGLA